MVEGSAQNTVSAVSFHYSSPNCAESTLAFVNVYDALAEIKRSFVARVEVFYINQSVVLSLSSLSSSES